MKKLYGIYHNLNNEFEIQCIDVKETPKCYKARRSNSAFENQVLFRKDDKRLCFSEKEAIDQYYEKLNKKIESLEKRLKKEKNNFVNFYNTFKMETP